MPSLQAAAIILSDRQHAILKQIVRRTTNPHRLVRRAQLLLGAAAGTSNTQISQQLELERGQVRLWRTRWLAAAPQLAAAETERVGNQELLSLMTKVLSDEPRLGTKKFFSVEQVVQIVALACETPLGSSRPVSHWSARELGEEAVLRGIVEKVSPRSVGRFLKGGYSTTAP